MTDEEFGTMPETGYRQAIAFLWTWPSLWRGEAFDPIPRIREVISADSSSLYVCCCLRLC